MSARSYRDYTWKAGRPIGREILSEPMGTSYKITADPYYKRISIEKYEGEKFASLVYDSLLLDFRSLQQDNQLAWEKKLIAEDNYSSQSLIKDHNDRVVYIEKYTFKQNRCVECHTYYPNDLLLSVQKMYHTELGEAFNGVILFDANHHPVMRKEYEIDAITKEFGLLLKEEWSIA
ncbi:Uncharacterized protein PHSC3_001969 [Chlamydiales bacterium STE3]|nr:Uncharacterized protein PHSC3_001969 [Chlamydiales bacterium STE3]